MSFAHAAGRLAGVAALTLGWRPAEFWAATPAELAAVLTAIDGGDGGAGVDADMLARLKEMYPDG